MQIGEEDLILAQLHPFGRLRFLHLHDQLRLGEDFPRARRDLGADREIIGVACADAFAGAGFDCDLMAGGDEFACRIGREADAIFMNFDLLDDADPHGITSMIRKLVSNPFTPLSKQNFGNYSKDKQLNAG